MDYLPFIEPGPWNFLGMHVTAFGLCMALGIFLTYCLASWRAAKVGLSSRTVQTLFVIVVGLGFVFAHIINVIFYRWDVFSQNPAILFRLGQGTSSAGGMLGGLIGYFASKAFLKIPPETAKRYFDCVWFAVPFGWFLGRMGCTFAHDHKGPLTTFFFAVNYPEGPRHNLGLYEALYSILIAAVFWWRAKDLKRSSADPLYFVKLFFWFYAPFRFFLDFLRSPLADGGDARTFGLTFAQFGCLAALGILILNRWKRQTGR